MTNYYFNLKKTTFFNFEDKNVMIPIDYLETMC